MINYCNCNKEDCGICKLSSLPHKKQLPKVCKTKITIHTIMIVPTTNKEVRTEHLSLLHPCKYEGILLQKCQSCGNNEQNHIRECSLLGTCTRGDTRNKDIQTCSNCSHYVSPYSKD